MSSVAKRLIIIFSIIFGIAAIVGGSVAVMLNRPSSLVARSDRLDTPVIRGVEKEGNNYMLTFSYIPDAEGYMVNEYDLVTEERHTKTYKGAEVISAGEYVKVDITNFLFNTHTEADFRDYVFTVTARYQDQVFNSKESAAKTYSHTIQLETPVIETINTKLTSVKWNSVEYATSYQVYLYNEEQQNTNVFIRTTEPYVTFENIKQTFGDLESYNLYVVAKNLSLTKQDYILDSEKSENALYIPSGKLKDINLTLNTETKTLTWPRIAGANNYYLYISTNGTSPYANSVENPSLFVATQNTMSCNLNNIEIASYLGTVEYYVKAISLNPNIEPSVSNKIIDVNKRQLLAPSNIKIVGDDTQNLKVLWDASADEQYTSGYVLRVYRYTLAQTQNPSIISAPQDYDVTYNDYRNINTCEYSFSLMINPLGYYGVAIKAVAPQNSSYKDSEFVYYKNENNQNYYNANKKLPAPNGIVAVENQDGTISVSWNRVQNALRYMLKIESADGTGSPTQEYVFTDKKEDINRVYSKIPPQTVTDLIPGKYIISVRSQSYAFSQSTEQDYNYSVSYPEGQNYAVYRIPFDLSGLNLQFNEAQKTLSWNAIQGAESYDVFAYTTSKQPTLVGNTTDLSYNLNTFFNNYRNETGLYKIYVVAKPTQSVYRVATKSDEIEYSFKQTYLAPTGLNVADSSTNGRTLEWQPSINENASTQYSVIVNGQVVTESTQNTSVDVTNYLSVGLNSISVYALTDEVNFESAQASINYTYKYTLSAINGEINFLVIPQNYDTPAVYLVFTEVKNALGYNVSINGLNNVLYHDLTPGPNGKSILTLTNSDVQKLNPYVTNTISVAPTNTDGTTTNANIIVPNNITKTANLDYIYALPALDEVMVLTTSLNTNIISKIADKTINIQFKPINIVDSTYDVVKPVTTYVINIAAEVEGSLQVINSATLDISAITLEADGSVIANIFDAFKADQISLFAGNIYVGVSAFVTTPAEVVAPAIFANTPVQIALGLSDIQNIEYNETQDGMILSWDSVLNATSYKVVVDGVTLPQTQNNFIDLQSVLYNKPVGNYNVTITAYLNDQQVSATQQISVKKALVLGEFNLIENNTKITFAQSDVPHTLYDGGDDYIYATHLVLIFDSLDAANLYATTEAQLSTYSHKIVAIADLVVQDQNYVIDISEFSSVQTCYIYAFNNNNLASVSSYIAIEIGGTIQYLDPTLKLSLDSSDIEAEWNIEYLPFENGTLTPAQYVLDVLNNGNTLITQNFIDNNFVVIALDEDNAVLWDAATTQLVNGNLVITITDNQAKTVYAKVLDQNAGNYVFKLQAVSTNRIYANSSNVVEENIALLKGIQTPQTRSVPYDIITNSYNQEDTANVTMVGSDSVGINIDDYIGHPFKIYFTNNSIDGIILNTAIVRVLVGDDENIIINDATYLIKQNSFGYYIELDKQALGIYKPEVYKVLTAYKSPNSAYYSDSDFNVATTIYVDSCTTDFGISNVKFTKTQANNLDTFQISWDNTLVPTSLDPQIYIGNNVEFNIYELLSNNTYDTTNPLYTYNHTDSSSIASAVIFNNTDISGFVQGKIYIAELSVYFNTATIEANGFTTGTYNIIPYTQKFLLYNENSFVVYDDVNNTITFTIDNAFAFESIDTIIINGNVYAVSSYAYTYNTVTLNNALNIINQLAQTLGNNPNAVPPQNRQVDVIVYAADKVLYSGNVNEFPVFVLEYAGNINLLNDNVLCWDSLQYVNSYDIYVNDVLKGTSNTNSIAMSNLGVNGGEYRIFVKANITGQNNVFITPNTKQEVTLTYLQPYETVGSITYTQVLPTYDISTTNDYQFIKTLTFKTGNQPYTAPASLDNSKFTITISGSTVKTLYAVSLNVYNNLADASNYVAFTRNDNLFSVDLTNVLNEEMLVGEYNITIVLNHIDSVASANDYKYFIQSKPSTLSIINNKVVSIPAANIWDYLSITPDDLITIGNNGIAQPTAGNEEYLQLVKDSFNEKVFVIKTPFKYATSVLIKIQPFCHGEEQQTSLNNGLGQTSSSLELEDTFCKVTVSLVLDKNTTNLGNFIYYYVPTLAELGLAENGSISVNSSTYTISRDYDKPFYITLPEVEYEVQTSNPDVENGVSGVDTITLNSVLQNSINYTKVIFSDEPPYVATSSVTTSQQYFIINIYKNEVVGGENTPKDYSPFVNTCQYQKIVLGAEQISINNILQEFNLPLGKYWVSVALYNGNYENASPYLLSGFNGAPIMFDYYFMLGNITGADYNNALHQISFNMVDSYTYSVYNENELVSQQTTKLNYFITLQDSMGNEKTFSCVVNPGINGGESSIESGADSQYFNIDQNKLIFDVDAFVKDLTRSGYYLVGNYNYFVIVASQDYMPNPQNTNIPLAQTADINNIISSQEFSSSFTYKTVYPVQYVSANLLENTLSWEVVDNSGLNLTLTPHVWQYKIGSYPWTSMIDVVEEATANGYICNTKMLLSYVSRLQHAEDLKLRLYMLNNANFLPDENGKLIEVDPQPKLPDITNFVVNTAEANGNISFRFDNTVINNSVSGTAYYLADLEQQRFIPAIDVLIEYEGLNYTITYISDDLITYYKNLNGSFNIISLMSFAQKQALTKTTKGVTELKEGNYVIKLRLYDISQNQYYLESVTEEQSINIVARWDITVTNVNLNVENALNTGLYGQNLRYYNDLLDANGNYTNKGLTNNNAQGWANGLRNTTLQFDIINPAENISNLSMVVWLIEYNVYKQNNNTLVARSSDKKLTYNILDNYTINQNGVCHIELDITNIWQTVTLPKEYYVAFYIQESKDNAGNSVRRKSVTSSHSEALNQVLGQNVTEKQDRIYAVINYKNLPKVDLYDYFETDNDGNTFVYWEETKTAEDVFGYDITITKQQYNQGSGLYLPTSTSGSVKNAIAEDKIKNGKKYKTYNTNFILDLENEQVYMVVVAVSNLTEDAYYIGNAGDANNAKAESKKMYKYLSVYTAPVNPVIESYTNESKTYKTELSSADADKDGITINNVLNPENNVNVVIVNEDTNPQSKLIDITFTQPSDNVLAYCIQVLKDSQVVSQYYIGRKNNNTSKQLFMYYSDNAYTTIYTPFDVVNASQIYINEAEVLGEIDGTTVKITNLSLQQLFGDRYNNGDNYALNVSAFIPVYFEKLNSPNWQDDSHNSQEVGVNPYINELNEESARLFRYYIKFATPQLNKIEISGDVDGVLQQDGTLSYAYIQNKDGKYSYTLTFTVGNIGNSTDNKVLGIYLNNNTKLSDMLLLECNAVNGVATASVTITENSQNPFAQLLNTSLPSDSLMFNAVILPKGLNNTLTLNPKSNSESYKDSNELAKNANINSMVATTGKQITLGVQLPNVPLSIYLNKITDAQDVGSVYNISKTQLDKDKYASNSYEFNNISIAVDPYLGIDSAVTKTRAYLYNQYFNTANFAFKISINNEELADVFNINDVLSCNGNININPGTNLYEKLKGISGLQNGGKATLKFTLYKKQASNLFVDADAVTLYLNFYVRDDTQYNLADFTYNFENVQKVSYGVVNNAVTTYKEDYEAPTVIADVKAGTNSVNNRLLVKLNYTYGNFTGEDCYIVVGNNSDVMTWILTNYANTTKVVNNQITTLLSKTNLSANNFILNALIGTPSTPVKWNISYTVQHNTGFTLSNYVGNSKEFSPKLKLAQPKTDVSYYNNSDTTIIPTQLSPITVRENQDVYNYSYYNGFSMFTNPIFKNINRSAPYIEITSVKAPDKIEPESVTLSPFATNNTYGNILNTISLENRPEFIEALKGYLESLNTTGRYTIYYRYVNYSSGNSKDKVVLPSNTTGITEDGLTLGETLSFTYDKYDIQEQNYYVIVVHKGSAVIDSGMGIPDHVNTMIGNILANTEYEGVLIMPSTSQKDYQVYLRQKSYSDNKTYYTKKGRTGLTLYDGNEYGYYYIPFNPTEADCLDGNNYTDAAQFIENFTTNHLGYLQSGNNQFLIIGQNPEALSGDSQESQFNLISIGKTETTVNHSAARSYNITYKLQADEYLKFDKNYEAILNQGVIDLGTSYDEDELKQKWDNDAKTKLAMNSVEAVNSVAIQLDKPCEKCHGSGLCVFGHSHEGNLVSNSLSQGMGGLIVAGFEGGNATYMCKHCGEIKTSWEAWAPSTKTWGNDCYRLDTCPTCKGSGISKQKLDAYTYEALSSGINSGQIVDENNPLGRLGDGYSIISWIFDSKQDGVYINGSTTPYVDNIYDSGDYITTDSGYILKKEIDGNDTKYYIVGRNIRIFTTNGTNVGIYIAKLMLGRSLKDITLHSKYNFRLNYGGENYINSTFDNANKLYGYNLALPNINEGTYTLKLAPKQGFENCFENGTDYVEPFDFANDIRSSEIKIEKKFDNEHAALKVTLSEKTKLYVEGKGDGNDVASSAVADSQTLKMIDIVATKDNVPVYIGLGTANGIEYTPSGSSVSIEVPLSRNIDALFKGMQISMLWNINVNFKNDFLIWGSTRAYEVRGIETGYKNPDPSITDNYDMGYVDARFGSSQFQGIEDAVPYKIKVDNFKTNGIRDFFGWDNYKNMEGNIYIRVAQIPYYNGVNVYAGANANKEFTQGLKLATFNVNNS